MSEQNIEYVHFSAVRELKGGTLKVFDEGYREGGGGMHELAVTRSIVDIVVRNAQAQGARRVVSVHLVVGRLRNFERPWVQRYFDRCAKGTVAQGARVDIDYVPIVFYCDDCGATFQLDLHRNERMRCADCGSENYRMVCGGEMLIKDIEVA